MTDFSLSTLVTPTRMCVAGITHEVVNAFHQCTDGKTFQVASWNVFCPDCGVNWAKRWTVDAEGMALDHQYWTSKSIRCDDCGDGSLWVPGDEAWNRSIPARLLLRELDICKSYHDPGIRSYQDYFLQIIWRRNHEKHA